MVMALASQKAWFETAAENKAGRKAWPCCKAWL
jgi:hypothetical protein